LLHGQPFRAFNVIDDFNREALNITISKSITSKRVVAELDNLVAWRGIPKSIRVDNGPEFIAATLREWCEDPSRKIALRFIEAGKPSQNGYVERFNRTYREDVLDQHLFEEPSQAQEYSNQWIWMYNNDRPHSSLNNLTPRQFLLKYGKLFAPDQLKDTFEQEFPTFQQDSSNINQLYKPLLLNVAK